MKKIIIGLAALLLLAVFVLPYITGRVAETVAHQVVEQVNNQPTQYGKLDFQQYERGMRSTDLKFSWSPDKADAGSGENTISYNCDAQHGLLNFSYECRAEHLPQYSKFIEEHLDGKDPLAVNGEVSIFGNFTQRFELDAFAFVDEEGSAIAVKPGLVSVETDQEFSKFVFDGEFGGLEVSDKNQNGEPESVRLGSVEVSGELHTNEHNLMIGDLEFEVSEMSGSNKSGIESIEDFVLRGHSKERGDNIDFKYQMQVGSFTAPTDSGAETEVEDLQFTTHISGVDMARFSKVVEMAKELAVAPEASSNALKLSIMPELEALLAPGLKLAFDISAEADGDDIEAKVDAELSENLSMGDFLLLAINPQAVLGKVNINMDSEFPKSLFENDAEAQARFESSEWFTKHRNAYRSEFQLKQGKISLNGKALTFEELMALTPQ